MGKNVILTVMNEIEKLTFAEMEYLVEILNKRIIEKRRENILKRSKEAFRNYKRGEVKRGSIKELYRDLESD